MAKDSKTGQVKDTVAKLYLQNPEIVADLFNAFTFKGEKRVLPEKLRPFPTEDAAMKLDADGEETTGLLRRDLSYIAYADDNAMYFLGIEVQSRIDWTMPLRVMSYDAAKYQYQVNLQKGRGRRKLLPVFTLVLNLSKGPWTGPRSLHDMMGGVDEKLKKVVPDYQINIADPYTVDEKTLDMLYTEIKDVLIYFRASRDKEGFLRFLEKMHDVSLSEKAVMVLNTYLNTKLEPQTNGRKTKMCVAWKYFKQWAMDKGERKGLRKGLRQGREEGREEGRKEIQKNVVLEALHINLDYGTIQKLTGFTFEEIKEIAAMAKA
ncbi:MAG: Rpn family recombination-promoting nuclease/putative transposase [Victivallales bacterium]|nr:Rpn family recombination-promoting nuclease/putative transposase [Victivallales bacterium]